LFGVSKTITFWEPGQPHPCNADRDTLSRVITHEVYPVAPSTLRRWPLKVTKVGRKAIYNVEEALAEAKARLEAAPTYRQAGEAPPMPKPP
jgi:hypothetical protein